MERTARSGRGPAPRPSSRPGLAGTACPSRWSASGAVSGIQSWMPGSTRTDARRRCPGSGRALDRCGRPLAAWTELNGRGRRPAPRSRSPRPFPGASKALESGAVDAGLRPTQARTFRNHRAAILIRVIDWACGVGCCDPRNICWKSLTRHKSLQAGPAQHKPIRLVAGVIRRPHPTASMEHAWAGLYQRLGWRDKAGKRRRRAHHHADSSTAVARFYQISEDTIFKK